MLRRSPVKYADLRSCPANSVASSPTSAHHRLNARLIDCGAKALACTALLQSMGPENRDVKLQPFARRAQQEAPSPPRLGHWPWGAHAGCRGSVRSAVSGRWALRQRTDVRQPVRRTGGDQPIEHVRGHPLALGFPWTHRGLERQPRRRPQAGAQKLPRPAPQSSLTLARPPNPDISHHQSRGSGLGYREPFLG